jgi:hypothetical protein
VLPSKNANELLAEFTPYLKSINPKFKKAWVRKVRLFKAPMTQPVVGKNYSDKIPPIKNLLTAYI